MKVGDLVYHLWLHQKEDLGVGIIIKYAGVHGANKYFTVFFPKTMEDWDIDETRLELISDE